MSDVINWITEHQGDLLAIITGIVTVASLIANLTPTEKDDSIVGKISGIINLLALNLKKKD